MFAYFQLTSTMISPNVCDWMRQGKFQGKVGSTRDWLDSLSQLHNYVIDLTLCLLNRYNYEHISDNNLNSFIHTGFIRMDLRSWFSLTQVLCFETCVTKFNGPMI